MVKLKGPQRSNAYDSGRINNYHSGAEIARNSPHSDHSPYRQKKAILHPQAYGGGKMIDE